MRTRMLSAAVPGWITASLMVCEAAIFSVTRTADSGAGSLRQAMLDANASPGPDVIEFRIPGTAPFTIRPATELPTVLEQLTLDATTQPGYVDRPVIELNGEAAGSTAFGLRLVAADCVVRGLAINRFARDGIRVEELGGNVFEANHIGTDAAGIRALGNGWGGVTVLSSSNRIGGEGAGEGNLISGGRRAGIYLLTSQARGNVVEGNRIGTDRFGLKELGNAEAGIVISAGSGNAIGGLRAGSRNIISGNRRAGIELQDGASSNRVLGNWIGVSADGRAAISNVMDGVSISSSRFNQVGDSVAGGQNVISGNGLRGVFIGNAGSDGNRIQGNLIGVDAVGTGRVGNAYAGVEIQAGSGNVVGGSAEGAGNVISANGRSGLTISGGATTGCLVQGNKIGTDIEGRLALGNSFHGIYLASAGNQVGGVEAAQRNVVSGNLIEGLFLAGASARSNVVLGNFIGLDVTGTNALANKQSGIRIEGPDNRIGGGAAGAGNVISGNTAHGVLLAEAEATRNIIQGNLIGTDREGRRAVANGQAGVAVENAPQNRIGGAAAGEGNLISGNGNSGIYLSKSGARRTLIQGNRVGTDASGLRSLPNRYGGIYLYGAPENTVGGYESGAGNLVSGNLKVGIAIGDPTAVDNLVVGNRIGWASDGLSPLGNEWHGLEVLNSAVRTRIGGLEPGAANRIGHALSAGYDGVRVRDGCLDNSILSNEIAANGGSATTGLAIDLGTDGVTLNDACDRDTGANQLQNFPVLRAFRQGTQTLIDGSLVGVARRSYRVQVFANGARDASGHGEAERLLTTLTVTTGADCLGRFRTLLDQEMPGGTFLSATATDEPGNTSECAAATPVEDAPTLVWLEEPADPGHLRLYWVDDGGLWRLEEAPALVPPVIWSPVQTPPLRQGGTNVMVLPLMSEQGFYRLILHL